MLLTGSLNLVMILLLVLTCVYALPCTDFKSAKKSDAGESESYDVKKFGNVADEPTTTTPKSAGQKNPVKTLVTGPSLIRAPTTTSGFVDQFRERPVAPPFITSGTKLKPTEIEVDELIDEVQLG